MSICYLCCRHSSGFRFTPEFIWNSCFFKKSHSGVPLYLCEHFTVGCHRRTLHSSDQPLLDVLKSRCKQLGDRSFGVAGPRLWNSLISAPPTPTFAFRKIKMPFIRLAFNWLSIYALNSFCFNFLIKFYCCIFIHCLYFVFCEALSDPFLG